MRWHAFLLTAVTITYVGVVSPFASRQSAQSFNQRESIAVPRQIGARLQVEWVESPTSAKAMFTAADAVVVAQAVSAQAGRVAGDATPVQFELVDFAIRQILKGEGLPTAISIERVADVQRGIPVVSHFDGGPFLLGSVHLLFLKRQVESPHYVIVNDQARYAVGANGVLVAAGNTGAVAREISGRTLGEVVGYLSAR